MKNSIKDEILFLLDGFDETELYLVERVKAGLYHLDTKIYDKLDFYDDSIYLNPFFFSCLNGTENEFLEILIGCYSQNAQFIVTTNQQGKIYLPKHGVFSLEVENQQQVEVHKENEVLIFRDSSGQKLEYKNTSLKRSQHGIEFFEYDHPLIEKFFVDSNLVRVNKHKEYFNSALEIIRTIFPELFDLIIKSVKKVVLFSGNDNSFATLETHGIIYLNVKDEYNEIFFVDDIVHQSAHVIFNTLTMKSKSRFFTSTYRAKLIKDKEAEGLYARFHGLYTMCLITICLTRCYKKDLFGGNEKIELIGRITDNMKKFKRLLEELVKPEYCTEEGLKWFYLFKTIYNNINEENKHITSNYDISDQPYVFDFNIFCSTNAKNL